MKKQLFLFLIFMTFICHSQENYLNIETWGYELGNNFNGLYLLKNKPAYIFGNNVKLRSEPNTKSETIKILKIGEKIEIVYGGSKYNLYKYNGLDWAWYKVKYKDKIGYILGGLISQETYKKGNNLYLMTLKRINDNINIILRVVNSNDTNEFSENIIEFCNAHNSENNFILEIFNNRGLKNIENVISIGIKEHLIQNTHYLFYDGESLKKVIKLKHSEDGFSHLYLERILFPNDKEGEKGKIIYKLHRDEHEKNFETYIEKFIWEGKELKPNKPKE